MAGLILHFHQVNSIYVMRRKKTEKTAEFGRGFTLTLICLGVCKYLIGWVKHSIRPCSWEADGIIFFTNQKSFNIVFSWNTLGKLKKRSK